MDRLATLPPCTHCATPADRGAEEASALAELHHRIGNDLQAIMNLVEQEIRNSADDRAATGLQRVARQVLAVGLLYHHMTPVTPGTVAFPPFLQALGERIANATDPAICTVRLAIDPAPLTLDTEAASRLAIAVNELVANAAKHAFSPGRPGTVTIGLSRDRQGRVALSVSDDGNGFGGPRPGGQGLGFVRRLVHAAGAELSLVESPGTSWTITQLPGL